MERYSNTGYMRFELRTIDKKRKLNQQTNNSSNIFKTEQLQTINNNFNDKILALFIIMIPSKGTNQITMDNNKIINATILDKDKKTVIRLQVEDIVNILDTIYKYENQIGYQNIQASNNDNYKYVIFRDKKEKNINVNIAKRFIYFSNKVLNITVGFELLYLKRYLEKVLDKIIEFELNNNINKQINDKVAYE